MSWTNFTSIREVMGETQAVSPGKGGCEAPSFSFYETSLLNLMDWPPGSRWRADWGEDSQQSSRPSASLRAPSPWCAFAKRAKEALGAATLIRWKTSKQRLNPHEAQRNAHLCQDCPELAHSPLRAFVPFPCSISEKAVNEPWVSPLD